MKHGKIKIQIHGDPSVAVDSIADTEIALAAGFRQVRALSDDALQRLASRLGIPDPQGLTRARCEAMVAERWS